MSRLLRCTVAVIGGLSLVGCSSLPKPSAPPQPAFDLRGYFDGRVQAWGQFQDYRGKVVRRFTVDMTGTWQGQTGVLDEHFVYDDGQTERRVWTLTDQGNGRFVGRAADVVGDAHGHTQGSAFYWRYTLRLPYKQRTIDVQFDDVMFRQDQRHVINRATVRKFGIPVGQVTLFFQKPMPADQARGDTP